MWQPLSPVPWKLYFPDGNIDIKLLYDAIVVGNGDVVGKNLPLDILTIHGQGGVCLLIRRDDNLYAVGNLQSAVLAQVLYAVDDLAGHTLVDKLLAKLNLKGYGQVALVADEPSGNILADDVYICCIHHYVLSLNLYGQ